MDYSEYVNKYKYTDKDILICACMNALENNKNINVNIEDYVNKVLEEKREYDEGKKVMKKLLNETDYDNFYYDYSTHKLYIVNNGIRHEYNFDEYIP